MPRRSLSTALAVGLAACGPGAEVTAPSAAAVERALPDTGDLVDEARARGVDYVNVSGTARKAVILEANGAGVALIDLSNDGDLDLVFAQGCATLAAGDAPALEVYENDGSGRFTRRAPAADAPRAWTTGLAVGDVDGDGDDDLVAGAHGGLFVYLQEPSGTLSARPHAIPAAVRTVEFQGRRVPSWFTSIALLDADGDGHLDLYAGRYLDLDLANPPLGKLGEGALAIPCRWKGHDVFCGPAGLVPQPDLFLRGRGDGTFEDRSATSLPGHVAGYTLGVLAFDADGDGDTDLFVANDSSPNLLLVNDGRGVFRDVAYNAGVALSAEGRAQAGMGVAAGDVDRDGRLDLTVTNFSDEPTELYLGAKVGFLRATHRYGLLRETRSLLSWGVHLADFDGDGWMELFSANGHVYPQADEPYTGTRYGQPATLWRLGPEPKAVPVAARGADSILAPPIGARGSAVGDLDLDGRPDLVLARIDAPAAVGMNRMGGANARLALRLLGPEKPAGTGRRTPRDGHGASAIVVVGRGAAEHALLAECQTAAGFQSASSPWLHFGLGAERSYEKLIVRWPSGRVDELPGGPAGQRLTIREGAGIVKQEAFR